MACVVDYDLHVSTARLPGEEGLIAELRKQAFDSACVRGEDDAAFYTDDSLRRFLVARNGDVGRALDMLETTLEWRRRRAPHLTRCRDVEHESLTGKIYMPGYDRFGRPLVVFDNTVQNTQDTEGNMVFLAWALEFSLRHAPPGIEKHCIFINLHDFSLFNQPPFRSVRETLMMLTTCFCERLGHLVVYRPPRAFHVLYNAVKALIDPKTQSKLVFITGDVSEGSPNDKTLSHIIGEDWKLLTGAEQPCYGERMSPGYVHGAYWSTIEARERALDAEDAAKVGDRRRAPRGKGGSFGGPAPPAAAQATPELPRKGSFRSPLSKLRSMSRSFRRRSSRSQEDAQSGESEAAEDGEQGGGAKAPPPDAAPGTAASDAAAAEAAVLADVVRGLPDRSVLHTAAREAVPLSSHALRFFPRDSGEPRTGGSAAWCEAVVRAVRTGKDPSAFHLAPPRLRGGGGSSGGASREEGGGQPWQAAPGVEGGRCADAASAAWTGAQRRSASTAMAASCSRQLTLLLAVLGYLCLRVAVGPTEQSEAPSLGFVTLLWREFVEAVLEGWRGDLSCWMGMAGTCALLVMLPF